VGVYDGLQVWEVVYGYYELPQNVTYEQFIRHMIQRGWEHWVPQLFIKQYARFISANRELFKARVLYLTKPSWPEKTPPLFWKLFEEEHRLTSRIRASHTAVWRARCFDNAVWCWIASVRYGHPLVCNESTQITLPGVGSILSPLQMSTFLASRALHLALPGLSPLYPEEILEVRDKLSDELHSFRRSMLRLSMTLRTLLKAHPSPSKEDILREADFLLDTMVKPDLEEVKNRIQKENARVFRRLLRRAVGATIVAAKILDPTETFSKWDLVKRGFDILLKDKPIPSDQAMTLGFLVKLPAEIQKMRRQTRH